MATYARPEEPRCFAALRLSGDLGATSIDELSAALDSAVAGGRLLLLDLHEVTYLTSVHISLILSAHKRLSSQQGALAVVVADANVARIFAIAGLSRLMNVFSHTQDAEAFLASFQRGPGSAAAGARSALRTASPSTDARRPAEPVCRARDQAKPCPRPRIGNSRTNGRTLKAGDVRQTVYTQQMAKPAEVVWEFISDLRNDCVWRGEVKDCELVSGEPSRAPASYRETIGWEGLEATVMLTVVESVRGSRVVISGEDETYSSTGVWTFEPQGEGTLVALEFSMETKGAVHLVEPFMWGIVTRWLERDLPRLESHL